VKVHKLPQLNFQRMPRGHELSRTDMTMKTQAKKTWTKPQVNGLGKLKDVQGPSGSGTQAAGGGQLRS